MAIQVRRGNESDFDASKMLPGEWAVSLDTKYVRMCFAPGVVLRMSTYEAFETDVSHIKAILEECRTIEAAIRRIQAEVNSKASLTVEYANSAKESADIAYNEAERAKTYANNAEAVTSVRIATQERAGLIKGGDNHIAEDGTLVLIKETTSTTLPNSHAGRFKFDEIGGVMEQDSTTGKNLLNVTLGYSSTKNGVTCTVDNEGVITLNGTASELAIFNVYAPLTSKAGKSYKLEVMYISGSTSSKVSVANQDGDNGWIGYNADILNSNVVHFYKYDMDLNMAGGSGIYVQKDTIVNNLKFKLMFIQTDVDGFDSVYEPYTGGQPSPSPSYPQEIKKSVVNGVKTHHKNLFDITTLKPRNQTQGGIVSFNGDVANISSANQAWATCISDRFDTKIGKNYTLSFKVSNFAASTATFVSLNDGESTLKEIYFAENGFYNVSVTAKTNILYVECCSNGSSNNLNNTFTISEAQIEEGEVATPYQRFQESSYTFSQPIELYGKDGVQDVITPKEVEREWTKKRITSSMNISHESSWGYQNAVFIAGFFPTGVKVSDYTTVANILCTHAITAPPANIANGSAKNAVGQGGDYNLFFSFENCTTIEEVKAFLDANEVYVHYILAAPTTEPLPIADQIALNSLATYDGITYIEFDSEIQPTFKGEYGTSKVGGYALEGMLAGLNGELLGKNFMDRITALEATVVNNI